MVTIHSLIPSHHGVSIICKQGPSPRPCKCFSPVGSLIWRTRCIRHDGFAPLHPLRLPGAPAELSSDTTKRFSRMAVPDASVSILGPWLEPSGRLGLAGGSPDVCPRGDIPWLRAAAEPARGSRALSSWRSFAAVAFVSSSLLKTTLPFKGWKGVFQEAAVDLAGELLPKRCLRASTHPPGFSCASCLRT